MLPSDLRDRIKEIADIAASVPENLQSVCFETLLRHLLSSELKVPAPADVIPREPEQADGARVDPSAAPETPATPVQSDIALGDLHLKTKRFMEKYVVTLAELNNVFYKEGGQIQPLYDDLRTTRLAESQIRLALLLALQNALPSGNFETPVEAVRSACKDRKCYDQANFSSTLKKNGTLFEDEYSKDTEVIRLSEDGRKEVAQLIKELQ